MSNQKIIRAWKDAEYRASLSDAERAQLPANPAGTVDLTPAEMEAVSGGIYQQVTSWLFCTHDWLGC